MAQSGSQAPRRERRAYVCTDKDKNVHIRRFLAPGEPIPTCKQHGKMVRQSNYPYRGEKR